MDKIVEMACEPKNVPPEAKYIQVIIAATYSENGALSDLCKALSLRLRESNATIVFKALIILHTMIWRGATDNVLAYLSRSSVLELRNMYSADLEGPEKPDYLQQYAKYLDCRICAYRDQNHDAIKVQSEYSGDLGSSPVPEEEEQGYGDMGQHNEILLRSKTTMGKGLGSMSVKKGLLKETKIVQEMMDAVVECRFYSDGVDRDLRLEALQMLARELLILFQAATEATLNILEQYFEMSRINAAEALSIYRHFCKQSGYVTDYIEAAKGLQSNLIVTIPTLRHVPLFLEAALQEYLDDPAPEQNRSEYGTNWQFADEKGAPDASKTQASSPSESDVAPSSSGAIQPTTSGQSPREQGKVNVEGFLNPIEGTQTRLINALGHRPPASPPQATLDPLAQMIVGQSFSQPSPSEARMAEAPPSQIHPLDHSARRFALRKMAKYVIPNAEYYRPQIRDRLLCHPKTRLSCLEQLQARLQDETSETRMIWLSGPAKTGKSAVLQGLAETLSPDTVACATLFLPQDNSKLDLRKILMTLAYRFATLDTDYLSSLALKIRSNPLYLDAPSQELFKNLLSVETATPHNRASRRWVVILDGLDQRGAGAEIVDLILKSLPPHSSTATQPIWVIASRPAPGLRALFTQAEKEKSFCWKLEMPLDSTSVSETLEVYLRDTFLRIQKKHSDVLPKVWPKEHQLIQLAAVVFGRFTLLSVLVDFAHEDPLLYLDNIRGLFDLDTTHYDSTLWMSRDNPDAPDLLYKQILSDIPVDLLHVTKRVLSYLVYTQGFSFHSASAQGLCNFLHLDRTLFYAALQGLHPVIDVPSFDQASQSALCLYDPSFIDFLQDADRSDKFFIGKFDATRDRAKLCLSWYLKSFSWGGNLTSTKPWRWRSRSTLRHTSDQLYGYDILPDLQWASDDEGEVICLEITRLAETNCWVACNGLDKEDKRFLSHLRNLDFSNIPSEVDNRWYEYVNKLWELGSSIDIVRTESRDGVDLQLLERMKAMTKFWDPVDPATFPLTPSFAKYPTRNFFLIGHAWNAVVCLVSSYLEHSRMDILNHERKSLEGVVDAYHDWLLRVGWFEADSDDAETEEE